MGKYRQLFIFSCIALVVLVSMFSSCTPQSTSNGQQTTAPQTTASQGILKIGMITSISGPISAAFKSLYDAAKPTEELLNSRGGVTIGGQKYLINIATEDDQSSPAGAVAAANKLIQSGVKFIISPIFPPALMAVTPVTNEAKVLSFTSSNANPTAFTTEAKYSFNCYSNIYDIVPFYENVKKTNPNIKRIALLSPDDPGAAFIIENVIKKELPKMGFEVVINEKYPNTIEDFYPVLPKVLASKPDAIELVVAIAPWVAGITNVSRELGFTGSIYGSACIGDMNQVNAMIKPGYNYDLYSTSIDPLSDKIPSIVRDLRTIIVNAKQPFFFDSFQPLSALSPALQGISKAQSLDVDKVAAALETMTIESPNGGMATWRGKEYGGFQHLLVSDQIPLSSISKNGKVEFVYLPRK